MKTQIDLVLRREFMFYQTSAQVLGNNPEMIEAARRLCWNRMNKYTGLSFLLTGPTIFDKVKAMETKVQMKKHNGQNNEPATNPD